MSETVGIYYHEFVGENVLCSGTLGYDQSSPNYGMICRQPREARIHTEGYFEVLPNKLAMNKDAWSTQVGGDHYKKYAIQPTEYIIKNELPFCEGNVVKYVTRWKDKGGIEDLKKARHYLDLLIEVEEQKNNDGS